MLDNANGTQTLTELMNALHELIDAAANNNATGVKGLARALCAFDGAGRSIISAEPIEESDGTMSIGAFFKFNLDPERYPTPRHPRRFDIVMFGALRWMDAACAPNSGQGFFYQPLPASVDGVQKYYLRFGNGGRGAGARVYVTRIIVDASAGDAARFAEEHHSYRRKDLLTVEQRNPRLAKGELGRSQAIKLAGEMFHGGRVFPERREGISSLMYEAVLLNLLEHADAFHGGAADRGASL